MRATLMYSAGDVRIENVPDAAIINQTDAVVRVTRACICGSDLWPYRTQDPSEKGRRMGHEAIRRRRSHWRRCQHAEGGRSCRHAVCVLGQNLRLLPPGLHTSCIHGGFFGRGEIAGAQAEAVRVPLADGTLFVLPVGKDNALMPSLLTLSDVMGTGHHAAVTAEVGPGRVGAVVGDGAVGVIAARRLGAGGNGNGDRDRPPGRDGRPRRRPRRGARRLSCNERPQSDQGHGEALKGQHA